MKKLFLAVLTVLSVITINNTVVKADDMRYTCEGLTGDIHTYGYMTLEDHTNGADFSLGYYEEDNELNEGGLTYYKIIDEKTVKLVDAKNSSGDFRIDTDYITYNGVTYRNIVIGNFKNNKKIKSIQFDNANSVVIKSKGAFENSSIECITLKGIKEIPANCFKNCKKLGVVKVEDAHKFKVFGKNSFYNCKNLGEIYLNSKYFTSFDATAKYMKKTGKIKFVGRTVFKNTGYFRLSLSDDMTNSYGSWTALKVFDKSLSKLVKDFDLGFKTQK